MSNPDLVRGFLKGLATAVRYGVPSASRKSFAHRLRSCISTGELAQHECTLLVGAGGDVFLGDEVHSVAQRGDEHDVGREVQGDEFGAVAGLER